MSLGRDLLPPIRLWPSLCQRVIPSAARDLACRTRIVLSAPEESLSGLPGLPCYYHLNAPPRTVSHFPYCSCLIHRVLTSSYSPPSDPRLDRTHFFINGRVAAVSRLYANRDLLHPHCWDLVHPSGRCRRARHYRTLTTPRGPQ